MKNIHIFGAPCTTFVEGHKHKLDQRGQSCTFLGINPLNQGYFILTPNNKVITSRNVIVHTPTVELDYPPLIPLNTTDAPHTVELNDNMNSDENREAN